MLPEILDSQNLRLVSGIVAYLQSECPCQKQPLMKMIVLYFGRTMSGLPGKSLRWSRKRKPCANKKRRTKTSGLVFLLLMCDIHFWRCSFDNTSAIKKAAELPCRLTGDQTFMRLQGSSVICCIRNVSYMSGLCQRKRRIYRKVTKNFRDLCTWLQR